MDALQDFLTAVIVFLEYLFLGYIALAFVVYSFERQAAETTRVGLKALPQKGFSKPSSSQSPVLAIAG